MTVKTCADKLRCEVGKVYVGKTQQISLIIMAVLSGGHVLLDDLPGSGKTTLVKALSRAMGSEFRRVQFTPDLLPSDIIGMTIFDQKDGAFRHVKGPVFTNVLLADEINRAIPRTQSALLEAMEEHQVSIDNDTFALPKPFLVLATQNPVERESTFQLPAAQMDRFFIRLSLGFPSREEEVDMLMRLGAETDFSVIDKVCTPEDLIALRDEIEQVKVSDYMMQYIVDLIHATRSVSDLEAGASPRASRSLFFGSKTWAAMQGRDYVTPEDVQAIYIAAIAHRVQLSSEARYTRKTAEEILSAIQKETPVPPDEKTIVNETAGK